MLTIYKATNKKEAAMKVAVFLCPRRSIKLVVLKDNGEGQFY